MGKFGSSSKSEARGSHISQRFHSFRHPREFKTHVHQTYTRMSTATLSTVASNQKPKCLSAGEQIKHNLDI